jgi:hypothetical protein
MNLRKDVFTEEAMAAELDAATAAADELCPATDADELCPATEADELLPQVPKALWQPVPQCPSVFPLFGVR